MKEALKHITDWIHDTVVGIKDQLIQLLHTLINSGQLWFVLLFILAWKWMDIFPPEVLDSQFRFVVREMGKVSLLGWLVAAIFAVVFTASAKMKEKTVGNLMSSRRAAIPPQLELPYEGAEREDSGTRGKQLDGNSE